MFEEIGLHGILKSCGSRIDHCVVASSVVECITFSDSREIFDSYAQVTASACVRKPFSAWKLEITRVLY